MADNKLLQLTSVYQPPRIDLLLPDIKQIFNTTTPTVAAGDFNSKHPCWNSRRTNKRGKSLYRYLAKTDTTAHGPSAPTFYHRLRYLPDVLDIAISKNATVIDINSINELASDHVPVIAHIVATPARHKLKEIKKVNWVNFTEELETNIGKLPTINNTIDLDNAVDTLTTQINSTVESATTKIIPHAGDPLGLPYELKLKIRMRNQLKKTWQRTRSTVDKTAFNKLRREIEHELQEIKNERWQSTLEEIDDNDPTTYKLAKLFRRNKKNYPPLHGSNGMVYTTQDKAEQLANSLENQCDKNYENIDLDHIDMVHQTLNLIPDTAEPNNIDFTIPDEVQKNMQKPK